MGWEALSLPLLRGEKNKREEASVVDRPVALLVTYSIPHVLQVQSCPCNASAESYIY